MLPLCKRKSTVGSFLNLTQNSDSLKTTGSREMYSFPGQCKYTQSGGYTEITLLSLTIHPCACNVWNKTVMMLEIDHSQVGRCLHFKLLFTSCWKKDKQNLELQFECILKYSRHKVHKQWDYVCICIQKQKLSCNSHIFSPFFFKSALASFIWACNSLAASWQSLNVATR